MKPGPPGKPKNTGVGSLLLLQLIFPTQVSNQGLLHCRWILNQLSCQGSSWSSESEGHSVVSESLPPHGLHSPWNSPGQNTGVGSLSLLQQIFPTQGSNPGLPHCRQVLYCLSHHFCKSNFLASFEDLGNWISAVSGRESVLLGSRSDDSLNGV